jgi:hypothetical protein
LFLNILISIKFTPLQIFNKQKGHITYRIVTQMTTSIEKRTCHTDREP